jgi:1-hydroxycarotenoid 3,4-desaturase
MCYDCESLSTAVVIGGGVGGMASSIFLARAGVKVTLVERAPTLGGKLREIDVGGRKFPGGPSVLTMRYVFDELFDGKLGDYVKLLPVEPLCRHFWPDGSQLDLFIDEGKSREAITKFAGARAADGYSAFRKHAAKIHEVVRGPFMENPIPSMLNLMSPRNLLQMTQIDGMRALWKALEQYFPDPRLRQLFGRYATYNGSSPFHAPATLAVIAHVENAYGIFACDGGIYRLAEALEKRARELGVEIRCGAEVESIVVEPAAGRGRGEDRARGVRVNGERLRADLVFANCDVMHVYERLLGQRKLADKYAKEELSLSAYVLLAVAKKAPLDLLHHNVFFSRDYRREFDELIQQRKPPSDPTVYLCADDRVHESNDEFERCFLLSNAPPLDRYVDWTSESKKCRQRIVDTLAKFNWQLQSSAEAEITPADFASRFPSSRGAIYGLSSNSTMAAFKRPANKVPGITGLYLAGGTVHPGAGLPMVTLSAKIASRLALEEKRTWM